MAPIFIFFGFSAYSQTGVVVINFTIGFDSNLAIKVLDTLGKYSSTELSSTLGPHIHFFFFELRNPIALQEVKHKADYA